MEVMKCMRNIYINSNGKLEESMGYQTLSRPKGQGTRSDYVRFCIKEEDPQCCYAF